jgi:hypothetical protein
MDKMKINVAYLFVVAFLVGTGSRAWGEGPTVRAAGSSPADLRQGFVKSLAAPNSDLTRVEQPAQLESTEAGKLSAALVEPMTLDGTESSLSQMRLQQKLQEAGIDLGKPTSLEELRKRLTESTSVDPNRPSDPRRLDAVRKALSQAVAGGLDPAIVQEAKTQGEQRLIEDRSRMAHGGLLQATAARRRLPRQIQGLAEKTALLPLPAAPATVPSRLSPQDVATERLLGELAQADSLSERYRLTLGLAAAHVGAGRLDEARALYEDIAQNADEESIRQAAARNLDALTGR